MWIATKLGFYSIVRKEDYWHIRARTELDLENLRRFVNLPAVEIWRGADYRFRIRVADSKAGAATIKTLIARLVASIDYENFKDEIAAQPDQKNKLRAYHTLWADMAALQD